MKWMKKDFEVAINVFLDGADMAIEEWPRRCVTWKIMSKVQKTAGVAVPWKQLSRFWNWFDGKQGATAGRPELAWCDSTKTSVQQLKQGCSEPTEGEQDLMRMCLQEDNYNSRA